MTLRDLLVELAARSIDLYLSDSQLRIRGPRTAITDELRAALHVHRDEIVDLLTPRPPPEASGPLSKCPECGGPTHRVRDCLPNIEAVLCNDGDVCRWGVARIRPRSAVAEQEAS